MALQAHTARRVGLVLSRFAARVVSVAVVVVDRGAEVVGCTVRVRCSPSWEVVEEVVDQDVHAAVERALARAARSMERAFRRGSTARWSREPLAVRK